MAVNLINSNDITITQTGDNIQLETPTPINTIVSNMGDITNLNTTDKSSLVNAINEVNSSGFMTITLNSTTSGITQQVIPFDTITTQRGNGFSLSNGRITIGSGISYVIVSSNISIQYNSGDQEYSFLIRKNATQIYRMNVNKNAQKTGYNGIFTPVIIGVSEGDIIDIYSDNATSKSIRGDGETYITIREI